MKKRKSPRKHKVNTKHPRYDVPNYPRGSGSMPMSKPSSPQYGIKLTYPVAQKPHPQSTHLATRIRSLGRVTHWSESHIVVEPYAGKEVELDTYIKGYLESQRASMKYAKAGNNRHVTPHGVLVERPETLSIINDIRKAKTLEEISTFKTADYYAMGLPNEDVYTIGNEIRRQQLQIKKNKANNIPVWVDQSHFSKSNITTLKGRLNSGKIKTSDIPRIERGRSLDPDFIAKGHASMKKTAFKKNGDPRSNSPFGHRENAVLRNLKEIRFDQFTNISRYGQDSFYVPVYSAYDHEGNGFQYYYAQGYNITG